MSTTFLNRPDFETAAINAVRIEFQGVQNKGCHFQCIQYASDENLNLFVRPLSDDFPNPNFPNILFPEDNNPNPHYPKMDIFVKFQYPECHYPKSILRGEPLQHKRIHQTD
jgi:hypothetical protein